MLTSPPRGSMTDFGNSATLRYVSAMLGEGFMKTVRLWVLGLLLGVAVQAQAGNTADGMDTWFGSVDNTTGMLVSTYPTNGERGGIDVTDNADRRGSIPYGTNNQFNNSPDYTGNVGLPPTLSTTVENRIVLKWPLNASPASIGLLCKGGRSVLCFSFLW
jgi:hypothetical protein